MSTITTKDGTQIYYKDWGSGPPIVFSHGWPLTADAWGSQMFSLASHGYRCIAHDRRGHGRLDRIVKLNLLARGGIHGPRDNADLRNSAEVDFTKQDSLFGKCRRRVATEAVFRGVRSSSVK